MTRHVVEEWVQENTWKCPVCGQDGNKGDTRKCSGCGRFKDSDTDDVVPEADESQKVVDASKLERAAAEPDVVCDYCQARVHRLDKACRNCGASWNESVGRYERADEVVSPPADAPRVPKYDPYLDYRFDPKSSRKSGRQLKPWLIGGGATVIGLTALVLIFWPWKQHARVTDVSWKYTTKIERRLVRSGSGWGTPFGAYNILCDRRYKGDEDCRPYDCNPYQDSYKCDPYDCNEHRDSYDCNPYDCRCSKSCKDSKNGYSRCTKSCDTCYHTCYKTDHDTCYKTCYRTKYRTCYHRCPVYDNWCTYNYDEWPVVKTDVATGTVDIPRWSPLVPVGVDERMKRNEAYLVRFVKVRNSNQSWEYHPRSYDDFRRFALEQRWILDVSLFNVTPVSQE